MSEPKTGNQAQGQQEECGNCSKPGTQRCGHCRKVCYCSVDCQKKHRKQHKTDCFPAKRGLDKNFTKKESYFATRDIKQGEVILEEPPMLTGPVAAFINLETTAICVGCNVALSIEQAKLCKACQWPLCGPNCDMLRSHTEAECKVFSKNQIYPGILSRMQHWQYRTLGFVRMLLLRDQNPLKWKEILQISVYPTTRIPEKCVYEAAIDFIRNQCNMYDFEPDVIEQIVKIDFAYGYAPSRDDGITDRTMNFCHPNHFSLDFSCLPNTTCVNLPLKKFRKHKPRRMMQAIATVDIKAGEKLTTVQEDESLNFRLLGTCSRRQKIHRWYGFWCDCPRCADPTELGTYYSAIKCKKCPSGYLLPINSLDASSNWICDSCKSQKTSEEAQKVILLPDAEWAKLMMMSNSNQGDLFYCPVTLRRLEILSEMENFREKYKYVLHPNHMMNYGLNDRISNALMKILKDPVVNIAQRQIRRQNLAKWTDTAELCYRITSNIFPGLSSVKRARDLFVYTMSKWILLEELVISGSVEAIKPLAQECNLLFRELETRTLKMSVLWDKGQEQVDCIKRLIDKVKHTAQNNPNPQFVQIVLPILCGVEIVNPIE